MVYSLLGDLAPPGKRATVLGLYFALQSTAGIIAPIATGAIVAAAASPSDGYRIALSTLGLLTALGGDRHGAVRRAGRPGEQSTIGDLRRAGYRPLR